MHEYKKLLSTYFKNKMTSKTPNLTLMLSEFAGARLIYHAGSVEKALFKAIPKLKVKALIILKLTD